MDPLFETLIVTVFSLAAFLLVVLVSLNLYLIKRNGFYVSVNCWFCNGWTKVAYPDKNSFDCPFCLQYNGFREDGSYNKVIKAQHDTSFTKYSRQKTEMLENGLCTYCNNNQQLKIYQLARFTPINEKNYDLEIEHFRKQLEKAYKLCKKCEKILKFTIDRQHSWLFGNRLKDLRRKGSSLLNYATQNEIKFKKTYFLRFIRLTLIILTILLLSNILNIRIVYPNINMNKYVPTKVFNPYKIILVEFYNLIFSSFKDLMRSLESLNMYMPGYVKIQTSIMSGVTLFGCFFDLILSFGKRRPVLWKINGLIAWILLVVTFSLSFSDHFTLYIFSTKIFSTLTLLCYYFWFSPIETKEKSKEYKFKKVSRSKDNVESSEEESDEEIVHAMNISSESKESSSKSIKTSRKSYRAYSPLSQIVNTKSFTANSVISTSDLHNFSRSSGSDLNRSLDNLHLTSLGHRSQHYTSPIFSVNSVKRPILSPAKLKNITQNPWTAGGFWKNDANVFSASVNSPNFSRSSSQSSGFVSTQDNNAFNSLPVSREPSINSEVDRVSILSEPPYHFLPINHSAATVAPPKNSVLYYKADNNTFYPVLSQNNMLFVQNGIPHQSFGNLSLRNFDTNTKRTVSPSVYSEKPVSPLFINLHPSESFRKS